MYFVLISITSRRGKDRSGGERAALVRQMFRAVATQLRRRGSGLTGRATANGAGGEESEGKLEQPSNSREGGMCLLDVGWHQATTTQSEKAEKRAKPTGCTSAARRTGAAEERGGRAESDAVRLGYCSQAWRQGGGVGWTGALPGGGNPLHLRRKVRVRGRDDKRQALHTIKRVNDMRVTRHARSPDMSSCGV